MRIFLFLPQVPFPPRSGGRIVTAPLVKGLAARHEVHVFALRHGLDDEDTGAQQLREIGVGLHTEPGTKRIDVPTITRAALSRWPYKVHRFTRPGLARQALELARHSPPDAVHCENCYMAPYAREFPQATRVLYQENFETLLLERWRDNARNPLIARLVELERNRTLRFEMECPLWFNKMVCISPVDEAAFRETASKYPTTEEYFRENLATVRPSIDLPYYDPTQVENLPNPFPNDGRKRVVFTGVFDYQANVDGAMWFLDEVAPKLDREQLSLWFVGAKPAPALLARHNPPYVVVTGSVPDVRPYLVHADAAVVPLRIGGGIRLKILEALALGCPVVSTSVGCEGLWTESDPPVWKIADEPAALAASIQQTLGEPHNKARLREWVEQRFSPARFVREMEGLYAGA